MGSLSHHWHRFAGQTRQGPFGFLITDNRRIGRDLQLYQSNYAQGAEEKIPLDWKALRNLIAEGGQVVQERKEYRGLVNKLLFKYENVKHYQEMLDLLIQLRSPKLSKDLKPSTMYEILNRGLKKSKYTPYSDWTCYGMNS